jgi:hypothetical protein
MTLREEDLLRLGVGTGHARKMVLRLPELIGGDLLPTPSRPFSQPPSAPQPPPTAPPPSEVLAAAKFVPARPVPRVAAACVPA